MNPERDATVARNDVQRRKRMLVVLGAVLLGLTLVGATVGLVLATMGGNVPEPAPTEPAKNPPVARPAPDPETTAAPEPIHVIAMGDMLPHDSVNANAKVPDGYNYAQFFEGIRAQLDAADVTFCNQEVPSAGADFGISGYPTFNAPTEFARDLHGAVGCDLVNLATNHNADKGTAGIAATRGAWDALSPAAVAGVNRSADEQRTVPILEVDGVRIALVAFAEFSNAAIDAVSLNFMGDEALVRDLMTQAREQADVVIVSAHWGTEDSHEVNTAQRAFAAVVAELGADVIIGTGPHVLQEAGWIDRPDGERTLVWYSLGNMLSTQLNLDQLTGVVAGFDIVRDEEGAISIENPSAVLTYMHYEWTAEEEATGALLARKHLSITPLADSDELLARTRFGVTAAEQIESSAQILGPEVTVRDR